MYITCNILPSSLLQIIAVGFGQVTHRFLSVPSFAKLIEFEMGVHFSGVVLRVMYFPPGF